MKSLIVKKSLSCFQNIRFVRNRPCSVFFLSVAAETKVTLGLKHAAGGDGGVALEGGTREGVAVGTSPVGVGVVILVVVVNIVVVVAGR